MRINNTCVFEGTAVRDMKTGVTKNEKDYASFTIVVYQGKDKDGLFIPCLAMGKQVEWIDVEKGDIVSVGGSLSGTKDEQYGLSLTLFCEDVKNYTKITSRRRKPNRDVAEEDCPF